MNDSITQTKQLFQKWVKFALLMQYLKNKLVQFSTFLLGVMMFNFSIYLAEIDAMQRLKPNKQLVEYILTLADDLQDIEEDPVPVIEVDLFFQHGKEKSMGLPFWLVRKSRFYHSCELIYEPQETVTPPPEG
jgi:hypothetical protein